MLTTCAATLSVAVILQVPGLEMVHCTREFSTYLHCECVRGMCLPTSPTTDTGMRRLGLSASNSVRELRNSGSVRVLSSLFFFCWFD